MRFMRGNRATDKHVLQRNRVLEYCNKGEKVMSNDNITDQEHIEPCPFCGAILYPINSQSTKMECLQKACGYSTVKSYPNLMKDRPFNIVTEAEIKERVRIANEQVAKAKGACWPLRKDKDCADICDNWAECTNQTRDEIFIKDYASGPEFFVLLEEIQKISIKRDRILIIEFSPEFKHLFSSIRIGWVGDVFKDMEDFSIAPTLALAVTEAWLAIFDKCKTCGGTGRIGFGGKSTHHSGDTFIGGITGTTKGVEIDPSVSKPCPKCKGIDKGMM